MRFIATDEQIKEIVANAVLASEAVGMGRLHYNPHLTKSDVISRINLDNYPIGKQLVNIDYYQGRMVKLGLWKDKEGFWEFASHGPHRDYQSWCTTYPTYEDLALSVIPKEQLS